MNGNNECTRRGAAEESAATDFVNVVTSDSVGQCLVEAMNQVLPLVEYVLGPQTTQQAQKMVMHPCVRESTQEAFTKAMKEAADVVALKGTQIVSHQSLLWIVQPDAEIQGRVALQEAIAKNTAEAVKRVADEVTGRGSLWSLKAMIQAAVEETLLRGFQEAVTRVSRDALRQSTQATVTAVIERAKEHLADLLAGDASQDALPTLPMSTRRSIQHAASQVTELTLVKSLNRAQHRNSQPQAQPHADGVFQQSQPVAQTGAQNGAQEEPRRVPAQPDVVTLDLPVTDLTSLQQNCGQQYLAWAVHAVQAAPVQPAAKRVATAEDRNVAEARSEKGIHDLSDDILVLVFRLLEPLDLMMAVGRVCSRWRKLALDARVWAGITLRYEPRAKRRFSRILMKAPALALLDCERMSRYPLRVRDPAKPPAPMPAHIEKALLETRCLLTGLRLTCNDLEPSLVVAVLRKLQNCLVRLNLTAGELHALYVDAAVKPVPPPRTPSAMLEAIDGMPELRGLSLNGVYGKVCFVFGERAHRVKGLEHLDLSSHFADSPFTTTSLVNANRDTLRFVALGNAAFSSSQTFSGALRQCSNLQELRVSQDGWNSGVDVFPALRRLTITTANYKVSGTRNGVMTKDTPALPQLQELRLVVVNQLEMIPLCVQAALGQVKSLCFIHTNTCPDIFFTDILKRTPALERLGVIGVPRLSGEFFNRLRGMIPNLKVIDLTGSTRCSTQVCWQPLPEFLAHHWPEAKILGKFCDCPSA